ncbi:MAG: hypothetical protein K2K90_01080 [Lachnospiraceae bacterium]|nr:hypothetical protein [Lachnospiraceae bacterium]
MTETERSIFDSHVRKEELLQIKFELMGQLLRPDVVKNIVDAHAWQSIYIYGGAYLGIQACCAFRQFIDVPCVIDRAGELMMPRDDIEVILPEDLARIDNDLPIIITPLEHARAIRDQLINYRSGERIFYLNELF